MNKNRNIPSKAPVMPLNYNLDVCRGCLNAGTPDDVSEETAGRGEDFLTVLQETFNIELCKPESTERRTLCNDCATKLQGARAFKEMVMRSEEMFTIFMRNFNCTADKQENVSLKNYSTEAVIVENELEDKCDDGSSHEDEPLSVIKREIHDEMRSSFGDSTKTTDNENTLHVGSKSVAAKVKKKTTAKSTASKKDWAKIIERRGNGPLLRENSLKIIEYTTACVFQCYKSKYTCFCCKQPFTDIEELKSHTLTDHTLKNIEKKIITQQNQMVKVDITVLNCKLCGKSVEDLEMCKQHLRLDHEIEFELKEDLLVPFKIGGDVLQCQICWETFTVFRLLNIHMNRHFKKQVCHICGAAFSNLKFLNLHKTRVHRKLTCKKCKLDFLTKTDRRSHDIVEHGWKPPKYRFPCPHCEARFPRENLKVLHLVEFHGLKRPEFKCGFCDKSFVTKSLCNSHTKSVHLKERRHACTECQRRFYSACDVARHRATHARDKKFACALCSAPYASKDSMRRHMKRSHPTSVAK